jgi:surfactin synthase thioesterase subunit
VSAFIPAVTDATALQKWLPYSRLDLLRPKVRLLCFAHAGGSALVFRTWREKLPWTIQTCAVQLPGRERRLNEPFITRMPRLIDELSRALAPLLEGRILLVGHSLGAKIAFEFARRLRSQFANAEVAHLFVSGSQAPHLRSRETPIYNLPEQRFLERLRQFGGTPKEVLANAEVMSLLVPRLRADFELDDTYTYEPAEPLHCPITIWGGESDELVPRASLEGWQEHTTAGFQVRVLQGSHFAFYEQEAEIIAAIRQRLATLS